MPWIPTVAVVTLLASTRPAASGWERYVPRRIQSVIEANAGVVTGDNTYFFSADSFPTRAAVVYVGQTRAVPPSRTDLIERYLGKMLQHPEWIDLYKHEILCREGEAEFWLPIQEQVLEYFRKEVPEGAHVEIYVVWVGAVKVGAAIDWVFLINEFKTKDEQTQHPAA
jgi:hypothetical protein